MTRQAVYQHCPHEIQVRIEREWEPKAIQIERLLASRFRSDERHLCLTVRHVRDRYEVHGILFLPTGTLVAIRESHAPHEALEDVADSLVTEVRRHKETLRHDDSYRRPARREEDLAALIPRLARHVERNERALFFDLLRPYFGDLREHARRELVIAQLEGRIPPGELSVGDLFDEVLLRAWEEWDERPRMTFDRWLVKLLHDVLDERVREHQPAPLSLEAELPPDDPRYAVDDDWVYENDPWRGEPEPIKLEEIVSDPGEEPSRILEAKELERWLLAELRQFPREQRRAFVLRAFEGWDEDSIARLLSRSREEVRADVAAVRAFLRERWERSQAGEAGRDEGRRAA